MPLYVVLGEDHRRNVVLLGDDRGSPFKHKEQAENLKTRMKLLTPQNEYSALPINATDITDPLRDKTDVNM